MGKDLRVISVHKVQNHWLNDTCQNFYFKRLSNLTSKTNAVKFYNNHSWMLVARKLIKIKDNGTLKGHNSLLVTLGVPKQISPAKYRTKERQCVHYKMIFTWNEKRWLKNGTKLSEKLIKRFIQENK